MKQQMSIVKDRLSFEEVWKLIEDVRSDPDCVKALNELIKSYTS